MQKLSGCEVSLRALNLIVVIVIAGCSRGSSAPDRDLAVAQAARILSPYSTQFDQRTDNVKGASFLTTSYHLKGISMADAEAKIETELLHAGFKKRLSGYGPISTCTFTATDRAGLVILDTAPGLKGGGPAYVYFSTSRRSDLVGTSK